MRDTGGKWQYRQSTGELFNPKGLLAGRGYAGAGLGKNNPLMQAAKNIGPLPRGKYRIGDTVMRHVTAGRFVVRLEQIGGETFGRSGFLMHGDNKTGTASEGCIIMPPDVRREVAADQGHVLEVVE